MTLKGIVSSTDINGTRVTFPDRENTVSGPLKRAQHVGSLSVGDAVAVIFFSTNLSDGLIIAKF